MVSQYAIKKALVNPTKDNNKCNLHHLQEVTHIVPQKRGFIQPLVLDVLQEREKRKTKWKKKLVSF